MDWTRKVNPVKCVGIDGKATQDVNMALLPVNQTPLPDETRSHTFTGRSAVNKPHYRTRVKYDRIEYNIQSSGTLIGFFCE